MTRTAPECDCPSRCQGDSVFAGEVQDWCGTGVAMCTEACLPGQAESGRRRRKRQTCYVETCCIGQSRKTGKGIAQRDQIGPLGPGTVWPGLGEIQAGPLLPEGCRLLGERESREQRLQ